MEQLGPNAPDAQLKLDRAIANVPLFSIEYDAILAATRRDAIQKKEQLIQSYPASPNFFSREIGSESLESYEPSILWTTPNTQYIRMRVDNIICNVAVTRACKGVTLVVDTLQIFQYSKDILDLYPADSDGFINLGSVYQEFPIKGGAIYILFEFSSDLNKDECLNNMRLDMMHPPYPFLNLYHMLDIPLDIIRHAYMRPDAVFTSTYSHTMGIIFDHPMDAADPLIYVVEGVAIAPLILPQWHPVTSHGRKARVLMFDTTRALPIQINVFPASSRPTIYFLTSNILSLLMNWQLACH